MVDKILAAYVCCGNVGPSSFLGPSYSELASDADVAVWTSY